MNVKPSQNPNAVYGGLVAGSGGGAVAAWLLNSVLDWNVPDAGVAAIAGGIAFLVLFVGREGLLPAVRQLLFGKKA